MDIKNYPPVVIVTMVVLSLTAFFGTMGATYQFGEWRAFVLAPFPMWAVVRAVAYGLLPMLAMIDMFHGKISGRYLGSLSMMMTWGFTLRLLNPKIFVPHRIFIETMVTLPAFGLIIAMAVLIVSFGFGKTSNSYFVQEEKD